MSTYELELPGVFLDTVTDDYHIVADPQTPILVNIDPEPDEISVFKDTDIRVDLAAIASGLTIDASSVQIYINNVLAFNGSTFAAGFNGPRSTFFFVQANTLRVVIDPTSNFASQARVIVRVVANSISTGFDPATLALPGWWRGYPGSAPWVGTASAGTSGSRSLVAGVAPTSTTLNGFAVAVLGGTKYLDGPAESNLVSSAAGSVVVLFKTTTTTADPGAGARWSGAQMWGDSYPGFGIAHFTTTGLVGFVYDGVYKEIAIACSAGAWHLAQLKWDSTNLKLRLDNGSWSSIACGALSPSALGTLIGLGKNYNASLLYNGQVAEVMTASSALADATFDNIRSYINARYALSI